MQRTTLIPLGSALANNVEEEVAASSTDWIDLGDRTHPNLKLVDKLKRELTYDGHENDLREAEQAHFEGGINFNNVIHRIRETEKMSIGDSGASRSTYETSDIS